MSQLIFIPRNTPSLKNSKIVGSNGVFHSATVRKYLNELGIQSYSSSKKIVKGYKNINRPNSFKKCFEDAGWIKPEGQIVLGFHFIRNSRRKFDFINAVQIIADLMTAHDFIEDDNMDYFIPVPMKMENEWYSYGKEDPGVFLKVLNY